MLPFPLLSFHVSYDNLKFEEQMLALTNADYHVYIFKCMCIVCMNDEYAAAHTHTLVYYILITCNYGSWGLL